MAKLIPPDRKQCQAETREGSFMTLGPRRMVRCEAKPTWIAIEIVAAADGQKGSMSLCDECKGFLLQRPEIARRVKFTQIEAQ